MQRATIIRNPRSSTAPTRERLERIAERYRPAGWDLAIVDTEYKGHARTLAEGAARNGASVVFACGGDGTANEVANGLAGTDVAMGLIPGGLTNVLARELEVPATPEDALSVLTNGVLRRVDVGLANGRRFLLQAGVGFDAEVIRGVDSKTKQRWGKAAFVLRGVDLLLHRRTEEARLLVDGVPVDAELFWLLLSNTPNYAGVQLGQGSAIDDGLMESYRFEGQGALKTVSAAAKVLLNKAATAEDVAVEKVANLCIETPGMAVHADGEDLGETPMTFSVERGALTMLLSPEAGRHLFSS